MTNPRARRTGNFVYVRLRSFWATWQMCCCPCALLDPNPFVAEIDISSSACICPDTAVKRADSLAGRARVHDRHRPATQGLRNHHRSERRLHVRELTTYHLVVRDALAVMEKRVNSRIFRNQDELSIVKTLFDGWRRSNYVFSTTFDYEFDPMLDVAQYPPRERCSWRDLHRSWLVGMH